MQTTWGKVLEHKETLMHLASVLFYKRPTPGMELSDYESLVFEVAFKVAGEWDHHRTNHSFRYYLKATTFQRTIDELRKIWNTNGWARSKGMLAFTHQFDDEEWTKVEQDYLRVEDQDLTVLYDIIDGCNLNDRERIIVTMLAGGVTKVQVAEALGISGGRVSQLLHSIRAKMIARGYSDAS